MEIEHLKSYLYQVKGYLEGGEQKLQTIPIDEVIECLEEGDKYKKVVDEIEEMLRPGKIVEIPEVFEEKYFYYGTQLNIIRYKIKEIKEKYFPKPKPKSGLEKAGEELMETIMKSIKSFLEFRYDINYESKKMREEVKERNKKGGLSC